MCIVHCADRIAALLHSASKSKAEPKQQTMAGPDRKDSPKPPQERMLSAVSKQYDFDGDGKLDEAEQAL